MDRDRRNATTFYFLSPGEKALIGRIPQKGTYLPFIQTVEVVKSPAGTIYEVGGFYPNSVTTWLEQGIQAQGATINDVVNVFEGKAF